MSSPNYEINKIVTGSFHQGDQRFGITAGLQCSINCVVATAYMTVKQIGRWNQSDLDYIWKRGINSIVKMSIRGT